MQYGRQQCAVEGFLSPGKVSTNRGLVVLWPREDGPLSAVQESSVVLLPEEDDVLSAKTEMICIGLDRESLLSSGHGRVCCLLDTGESVVHWSLEGLLETTTDHQQTTTDLEE